MPLTVLSRSRPGSSPAIGSFLAPDVQSWLASPEQGLSAATESVRGADATAEALARLAPSRLTVVATVSGEHACWAEIVRSGDGAPETCIAGLTYNAAGQVSRLVWLRAPFVPASALDAEPAAPDGRPILERYFAELMGSRFDEAAAHFTADTIYSHPPYAVERCGFSSGAERRSGAGSSPSADPAPRARSSRRSGSGTAGCSSRA